MLDETKAISIPEKKAASIKQVMMIPVSMAYFLLRSSNFFTKRKRKKNMNTARAAIPKLSQYDGSPAAHCV